MTFRLQIPFEEQYKIQLYYIGLNHFLGQNGFIKNYTFAFQYIKLSADQGFSLAQYFLSCMYQTGSGIEKDKKKSLDYCKRAADQGHIEAQYWLGFLFSEGRDVTRDYKQAFEYFKKAADVGRNSKAQYAIAQMYEKGLGTSKNAELAFEYYKLSAEDSYHQLSIEVKNKIQQQLGFMYEVGIGTEINEIKAAACYKKAADNGDSKAQYKLACLYAAGKGVLKPNKELAFYYHSLAAKQGHFSSKSTLAVLYEKGIGVKKDDKQSFIIFKELADNYKVKVSQYKIACMYETGRGVGQDDKLAAFYMELAAKQGHLIAQHNISIRYAEGRGVEKNITKSKEYYQRATTVEKEEGFDQLVATLKYKNLKNSPILLTKIFEKTPEGMCVKGLYEYLVSTDIDLDKSYLPFMLPSACDQRGSSCGAFALRVALEELYGAENVPPVRHHLIPPTKAEKEKDEKEGNIPVTLRYIMKKNNSVFGEALSLQILENTAKYFGFSSEMLQTNKEKYIETLLLAIKTQHNLILPVDDKNDFPGNDGGRSLHYALACGYLFLKNQYYILVMHRGAYCLWDTNALLQSHEQIPEDKTPLAGEYYKHRDCDDYIRKTDDQTIEEKDRRVIKPYAVNYFKFSALAIKTKQKNCLSEENCVPSTETTLKLYENVSQIFKSPKAVKSKEVKEIPQNIKKPKSLKRKNFRTHLEQDPVKPRL